MGDRNEKLCYVGLHASGWRVISYEHHNGKLGINLYSGYQLFIAAEIYRARVLTFYISHQSGICHAISKLHDFAITLVVQNQMFSTI